MYQILSKIFSDTESLLEYERYDDLHLIDYSRIYNRLIALVRCSDPSKIDSYYEGVGESYLSRYNNLASLMCCSPKDWGDDSFCQVKGKIYVKEEKFEEWTRLIVSVSPLWLIAGFLAGKTDTDMLRSCQGIGVCFRKWIGQFRHTALLVPYIPNLEYLVNKEGGLNDLHIHLNGSTEIDVLWNHMLRHRYVISKDYKKEFYRNSSVRKLSEQIMVDFTPGKLKDMLDKAVELRDSMIETVVYYYGTHNDFECSMTGELLLYILVLKQLRNTLNEELAAKFHRYLLLKGLVQRFVVMQHSQVGFSQFQLITDNSFRWDVERYYKRRFLQLAGPWSHCVVKCIEGRFAPKESVGENRKLIKRIVNGFNEAVKLSPETLGATQLSLIAHFIKKAETKKDKEYETRHYFLRKELKRKAFALMKIVKNNPQGLGKYVKGIDAAASEFDAGPEVFAPLFRFLRETGIEHITYHVGEDFRHLLTGLRTVYEAVVFLDLRSGDRLGHCTALGIDPHIWRERVGKELYVCRGEWLDDLVFVWCLIKDTMKKELQPMVHTLESEILKLSKEVYGEAYHPFELSGAWFLRKYSIRPELNCYYPVGSLYYYDSKNEIEAFLNETRGVIWQKYNEPLKYRNSGDERIAYGCRYNYDETIKINTDSLFDTDSLKSIQLNVMEILTQKNVIIEALPTSNLHISLYKSLKEYHLLRWVDTESSSCMLPSVVLGSDDPGIFMTNIYNEYAMAYLHFGLNKCPVAKRLEFIRYLKEYSEIYGFHNG